MTIRSGHTPHLSQRLRGVGDEVEHKQGKTAVKDGIPEVQMLSVTPLKGNTITKRIVSGCVADVFGRRVYPCHLSSGVPLREGKRQCSGSRTNVEQASGLGDSCEIDKQRSYQPAPTPHEPFIRFSVAEHCLTFLLGPNHWRACQREKS